MAVNLMELDEKEQIDRIVKLVNASTMTNERKYMDVAQRYYEHNHDIKKMRMFYRDNEGKMIEETARSNVKIAHSFFTEIVDQKVQYLLSNGINIEVKDNPQLQEAVDKYNNEDFLLAVQELLEGASIKGHEYLYIKRDNQNKLAFEVADARNIVIYSDNFGNTLNVIRFYDETVKTNGKDVSIRKYELYDDEVVKYFTEKVSNNQSETKVVIVDPNEEINPRPHVVLAAEDEGKELLTKGFGKIPFLRLDNNKGKESDLTAIKDLIDDYDLMASSLSNNLVDFDQPIYAVIGFQGDNLDTLVNNMKVKRAVGVSPEGGIDVKTVDIPVAARKEKIQLDKEAIYKFGMAFDSSQVGDGNITNVVIKSRYSLLDLKCNKAEVRLKKVIKDLLHFIIDEMNETGRHQFEAADLTITFDRSLTLSEKDTADTEYVNEQTRNLAITTILNSAARIGDDKTLELICEVLDLDYEELLETLDTQDYSNDSIDIDKAAQEALALAKAKEDELPKGSE